MSALTSDTTGTYYNTAVGYQTFLNLTSPISLNTPSQYNIALGYLAGANQLSYKNCTFLGALADATKSSLTNSTAIGFGAKVSRDSALVLGNGCTVGIGTSSPTYPLHIAKVNNTEPSILLSGATTIPSTPLGNYDVCLWAQKGNKYGALFYQSNEGGVYKIDTTSVDSPAREPKIPVLTADEIQNLQEIALGAIVYDSTNDTVIISTKSGWQNLTRSPYNPQSLNTGI
jgi:hypothetical protein